MPQWLLELTGDPNRVVKFGIDYSNGKVIRFSWNGLVVPACRACNSKYGDHLEAVTKTVIESLLDRNPVTVRDCLVLLDWLDKVRVGLWLNYKLLQKIPSGVEPHFRIDDRIGKKDRMVAVYTLDTQEKGLNAFGVETLLFHSTPSCFGLKINNLVLVNMSADYLFSTNCGFPAPRSRKLLLDGPNSGMLQLGKFLTTNRVTTRILDATIIKPSIQLYQPIMQRDVTKQWPGGFLGAEWQFDSFLAHHTLGDSGQGVCFRQYADRVEPLTNLDDLVDFDEVSGSDCALLAHIIAQIYELQIYIQKLYSAAAKNKKSLMRHNKLVRQQVAQNQAIAAHYRGLAAAKG